FAHSLAQAYAGGVAVEWGTLFARAKAKRIPLPTYPFQRQRYWQAPGIGGLGGLGAGISAADAHPLLGEAVELVGGSMGLGGHLSRRTLFGLLGHAAAGRSLLPGSVPLELALQAGLRSGAETIEELTMHAPLNFADEDDLALQVTVGVGGEEGRRAVEI